MVGAWCAFGCLILIRAADERRQSKRNARLTMLGSVFFVALTISWPFLCLGVCFMGTPYAINAFFSGLSNLDYRTIVPTLTTILLLGIGAELTSLFSFTTLQKIFGLKHST
jgi:hypothetical protein